MRVKSLDAYDIKNDIVDVNSKEILMQSNNIIYEKIQSHFKINLFSNSKTIKILRKINEISEVNQDKITKILPAKKKKLKTKETKINELQNENTLKFFHNL